MNAGGVVPLLSLPTWRSAPTSSSEGFVVLDCVLVQSVWSHVLITSFVARVQVKDPGSLIHPAKMIWWKRFGSERLKVFERSQLSDETNESALLTRRSWNSQKNVSEKETTALVNKSFKWRRYAGWHWSHLCTTLWAPLLQIVTLAWNPCYDSSYRRIVDTMLVLREDEKVEAILNFC